MRSIKDFQPYQQALAHYLTLQEHAKELPSDLDIQRAWEEAEAEAFDLVCNTIDAHTRFQVLLATTGEKPATGGLYTPQQLVKQEG